MILHLLDDNKFADYAISQFEEAAPGGNVFAVFVGIVVVSYGFLCGPAKMFYL